VAALAIIHAHTGPSWSGPVRNGGGASKVEQLRPRDPERSVLTEKCAKMTRGASSQGPFSTRWRVGYGLETCERCLQ
jgi:hypothetical protein